MKLIRLLFLIFFICTSNLYAEIYKLNCKYSEEFGGGNKSVKTSVWYINNEKKMIALAKINNNNVKYTSNKWDNESFGVKNNEVLINRSQIKIKDVIYYLLSVFLVTVFQWAVGGAVFFLYNKIF